jgi:3-methylcrotonyl-CoA carboxylase beta subunit
MSAQGIAQIAVVMGSCTAGGAYVPAMSDETIIVKNQGTIFLGGPPLVKAATGEVVSAEDLGGGDVHTRLSGVADHLARTTRTRWRWRAGRGHAQHQASRWPAARAAAAAEVRCRELYGVIPTDTRKPYDVREIIARIVDGSEFHEFKAALRRHAGVRLCAHRGHAGGHRRQQRHPVQRERAEGRALHRAVLPAQGAAGLPAEHHRLHGGPQVRNEGIARHGAKMVTAVATASVPKFTVIIGGSYGAGNYGMCGRAYSPRFLWMWPNARICVMGGEQASPVCWPPSSATASRPAAAAGAPKRRRVQAAHPRAVRAPVAPVLCQRPPVGRRRDRPRRHTPRAGAGPVSAALNAPIPEPKFGVFRM